MAVFYGLTLDLNVVMKANRQSSSREHELQAAMAMLTLLSVSTTPNWWDADDFVCLREVRTDSGKDVDLDVLQAAIDLGHRGDKFLRDRTNRRVAMKRLYQRYPVNTLCQEGVGKCSSVMGASFILLFILYQIFSKLQPRVHAARIKSRNRAAVVRAVRADRAARLCRLYPSCHKADSGISTTSSHYEDGCRAGSMTAANPAVNQEKGVNKLDTKPGRSYLLVVIRQLLLLSGDVELNPGPLDVLDLRSITNELGSVIDKWFQIGVQLGVSESKLRQIEADYHTLDRRFSEMISFWLNGNTQVPVSWMSLVQVLESRFVSEKGLANQLREKAGLNVDSNKETPLLTGHQSAVVEDSQQSLQKAKISSVQLADSSISSKAVCTHQQEGSAECSNDLPQPKPKLTFPSLDQTKMSKEEKEKLHQRLYAESMDITFKFQDLFSSTVLSLKECGTSPKVLYTHLVCLGSVKPAYHDPKQPVLRHYFPQLRTAERIEEAMGIVGDYCSFFNFGIIELVIDKLGTTEDKANLTKYKKDFSDYARRHVYECPSELGAMTDGNAELFMTLDETYDNYTVSSLQLFVRKLAEILKLSSDAALKLCKIELGSLKLTFQIPDFVQEDIFPLSIDQKRALAGLGVVHLSCGDYYFTNKDKEDIQQLSGTVAALSEIHSLMADLVVDDDVDSTTDSVTEAYDAAESDVDLVSMVMGKSTSSITADSALGTLTAGAATRSQVTIGATSQFSENLLERDLRDEPYLRMEREAAKLRPPDDSSGLELHLASFRGEIDTVKLLVETENVNPLLKDKRGNTALHWAAMGGGLSVMKFFIEEKGLSPSCQGQYGRTALHIAAEFKHLELVHYLVSEQQVDPLCKDEDWGYTSLHTSCIGGNMDAIKFLANEMQNYMSLEDVLNERSKNGHTPFHLAAFSGHLPVIKFFISKLNFDPNTPGYVGRPALHDAAQQGHLEVVSYLIEEAKCDPSCCPGEDKDTPLHLAAQTGHLDVVRYLTLKHHSNPLSRNSRGNTPLHLAALDGHFKVVAFFISELNCDPNAPGLHGRSPLHHACQGGSMDIVKYLIEQMNCNASQVDQQQVTPLRMAAMNGHLHIVKYLIEDKLCNPLCRDSGRNTPLHDAAQEGHLEVVQYYIQTIQCSPNIRGWHNMTPLEQARSNGHSHVVSYLESLSTK